MAFFSNPISLPLSLISIVFFIAGYLLQKYPPKKINSIYGYRTRNSQASQERWDFAQQYSAKLMMKLSTVAFLIAPLALIINPDEAIAAVITILVVIGISVRLVFKVEDELDRKFGKRR